MTNTRNRQVAESVMGWVYAANHRQRTDKKEYPTNTLWLVPYIGSHCTEKPRGTENGISLHLVPDYLHDEHACHEALKRVDGWTCTKYKGHDYKVSVIANTEWFMASALTFCEAAVDAMLKASDK